MIPPVLLTALGDGIKSNRIKSQKERTEQNRMHTMAPPTISSPQPTPAAKTGSQSPPVVSQKPTQTTKTPKSLPPRPPPPATKQSWSENLCCLDDDEDEDAQEVLPSRKEQETSQRKRIQEGSDNDEGEVEDEEFDAPMVSTPFPNMETINMELPKEMKMGCHKSIRDIIKKEFRPVVEFLEEEGLLRHPTSELSRDMKPMKEDETVDIVYAIPTVPWKEFVQQEIRDRKWGHSKHPNAGRMHHWIDLVFVRVGGKDRWRR